MSFAIFFFLLAFLSLMGVEIIEDKQPKKKNKKNQTNKKKTHYLHIWNYNRKINQMKHLLINEAYFIISSVNDKKNFSTAVAFKKSETTYYVSSSVNR